MAADEKMNKATIILVIGIMLIGVNATIVTSTFDGLISEGMADNVANAYTQEELIDDDWNESTYEKVYFGYNLTDIDALSSEDPSNAYTKVGPWIYNVTSHKELIEWNSDEGTMTYSEYEVFDWCGDCTWEDRDGDMGPVGEIYNSVPGTNDFTNVNILWTAQSIAAIGAAGFDYGEPFAKAGFATEMMTLELSSKAPSIWSAEELTNSINTETTDFLVEPLTKSKFAREMMTLELSSKAPSIWSAEDISNDVAAASNGMQDAGMDAASADAAAPSYVMSEAYALWNASSAAGVMEPDFTSSANMILEDAVDPSTGMCIALTCDYGHMLVAGMGEPSEEVTPTRAALYGYSDVSEPERTHIDWAVYALAGSTFLANGGGADLTTVDNNRDRLYEVSGVDIANPAVLEYVLFGVNEDGLAQGIIQETVFAGTATNGNWVFVLQAEYDAFRAMGTYGIGLSQLLGLAEWAGAWNGMLGVPAEFPMILTGGSGTINVNDWWIEGGDTFGIAGGIADVEFTTAKRLEFFSAFFSNDIITSGFLMAAYDEVKTDNTTTLNDVNMTVTNMIFYDAVDPSTGMCIALTCDYGHMLVAGMGEPSEAVTPTRAALYGYSDVSEPERTHIDWAVYALAGSTFLANGGGADLTTVDNNRERLAEVSGVDIANPAVLEYVLFGVNEDGLAQGIIQETDFNGLPLNGNILFLLGAQEDAFSTMSTYGTGLTQLLGLADWAGAWIGMVGVPAEFPMILTGGSETMNANDWWIASFGGEEPLAGGYIPFGLNMGEWEGQIDMSEEDVINLLYDGPYALAGTDRNGMPTADFGSEFMYGEATGKTLPQGVDGPEAGGEVSVWNDTYVANLYEISTLEAQAVSNYISNFMVDEVVPALLTFQTGSTAYTTQTVDEWLFGSCDPVTESLYGSPACYTSLETNKTYFGSGGVSTGDDSAYVMSIEGDTIGQRLMQGYANTDGDGLCDFDYTSSGIYLAEGSAGWNETTGGIDCAEGQVYGMTEYLTWRAPAKDDANYGLMEEAVGSSIDYAVLENSIGAIGTADESFKYNLGGYAVAMTEVGDNVEFKGIPMVEHSIVLDATQHNIQSKLIPTSLSPISVTPGVLGLYFNGNVDFKVEPNTNAVMYGHGTLQFVLDIRGLGYDSPDLSEGATDAYPVFEIAIHSEIDDEGAEDVRGATDSIGIMGFTNLDAPMPILALNIAQLVVYLLGLGMTVYGGMNMSSKNDEE